MSRDPERRPKNAHEFIERLKAVTGGERPGAWPTIIMRDSRSTLQGVLPERAASTNDEPSILDVFGEDSVMSPPPPVRLTKRKPLKPIQTLRRDVGRQCQRRFCCEQY